MRVQPITPRIAADLVVRNHYLHRKPNMAHAFGLYVDWEPVGVITFGPPASRHVQQSACPIDPDKVTELNRLWVADAMPRNTETFFIARALALLPPMIVISYADTEHGHAGYVYRAANFFYAGLTDQDRKTPRCDYVVAERVVDLLGERTVERHSREAFRGGHGTASERKRRLPKHRYWIATGNRRERHKLQQMAGWPRGTWLSDLAPIGEHG